MRVVLLFVLTVLCAAPAQAALAWVRDNSGGYVASSGSDCTVTFGANITAGNAIILFINYTATSTRTFTVSDNVVGSTGWTKAVDFGATLGPEIWYRANHDGGAVTITAGHASTGAFLCSAAEFSGFGATITVDATDTFTDAGVTDNHASSDTGVSSANEVVAVIAGNAEGANFTDANGTASSYTEVPAATVNATVWAGFRVFASGATNETGAWVSTGTDRVANSVIALLSGPAAASSACHRSLLGVGC